jgi:multidrug efflux pump
VNQHFAAEPDGLVVTFNPPAVPGLGTTAGFEFQLQARGITDVRALAEVRDQFLAKLRSRPEVVGATSTFNVRLPQVYIDVDRDQTKSMGSAITDVFNTLQAYFGSLYICDFDKFGRIWQVQLMAEPKFRSNPEDIARMYVRNQKGEMSPISAVLSQRYQAGPNMVTRLQRIPLGDDHRRACRRPQLRRGDAGLARRRSRGASRRLRLRVGAPPPTRRSRPATRRRSSWGWAC